MSWRHHGNNGNLSSPMLQKNNFHRLPAVRIVNA